jgi:hypothetical protein
MDTRKINCFICEALFSAVIASESVPVFCHSCEHASEPHPPERNFAAEVRNAWWGEISDVYGTMTADAPSWHNAPVRFDD